MKDKNYDDNELHFKILKASEDLLNEFRNLAHSLPANFGLSGLIKKNNRGNQLTLRDVCAKALHSAMLPVYDDMMKYMTDKTIKNSLPYESFIRRCVDLKPYEKPIDKFCLN